MAYFYLIRDGETFGMLGAAGDKVVGRVHPSLTKFSDDIRRAVERHVASGLADLSCRVGIGGKAYWLVPVVPVVTA